jgi:hypothetical protein
MCMLCLLQHPSGYEASLDPWLQQLWAVLRQRCPLPPGVQQVGRDRPVLQLGTALHVHDEMHAHSCCLSPLTATCATHACVVWLPAAPRSAAGGACTATRHSAAYARCSAILVSAVALDCYTSDICMWSAAGGAVQGSTTTRHSASPA